MPALSPVPTTVAALEELLSRPGPSTSDALDACPGDLIVLGAGGKMGPTLARMARRAVRDDRRVIAVSRFSSPAARRALEDAGVETIACNLADASEVARLPDAPNVVYMAGQKFGTTDDPSGTWTMNVVAPLRCAERYAGSRISVFSTGNVYPLTPVARGGSVETDAPLPTGEYAASCVGRERVFESIAARSGASTRLAIIRLNYAIDLRYGVLVDLACRILDGTPIDLAMGHVNVIWQGDANRIAIEALRHAAAPQFAINVTGTETLRVRDLAAALGARLGREPILTGTESSDALLSNASRMAATFGAPETSLDWMLDATASWLSTGGPLLGKETRFEVRDGKF